MIEIEIQNETHQSQVRLRFAAVPRIGEGIRLLEPNGCWASYDVLDLWYQKADFGDVWVPYLHVAMTPAERAALGIPAAAQQPIGDTEVIGDDRPVYGEEEFELYTG